MDRLVLSLLRKQQSMCQANDEEESLPSQRHNGGFIDAEEFTSSLSIMPLSFQKFLSPDDHQESCITSQPSHQFHVCLRRYDLLYHFDIYALRPLIRTKHLMSVHDPMLPSCQEVELIHDLRSDVAEIHHEIAELRKLLKNCVDEHSKLQILIRDEVSSLCLSSGDEEFPDACITYWKHAVLFKIEAHYARYN